MECRQLAIIKARRKADGVQHGNGMGSLEYLTWRATLTTVTAAFSHCPTETTAKKHLYYLDLATYLGEGQAVNK